MGGRGAGDGGKGGGGGGGGYEDALKAVSQGGTPSTRKLLAKAIEKNPEKVKELQGKIKKDYGNNLTLYRATRGSKLKGIESFTDSPNIAGRMGANLKMTVPVSKIVGHYKYQAKQMWRSAGEHEVLVNFGGK